MEVTSRSVMRRVLYDGSIHHKALTHRYSAKEGIPSCSPGHSFYFVAQECVRVLACMCARFSFIKKIPTGNSHTLSSR